MTDFTKPIDAKQMLCIGLEQPGQGAVIFQRHVTGQRFNFDGCPHGQSARAQGPIHFFVGIEDGLRSSAADIGFHTHFSRYHIDEISPFCDHRMNANGVFISVCSIGTYSTTLSAH